MSTKYKAKQYYFEPFESTQKTERYVRISKSMYTSKAWKSLKSQERDLYIAMKIKFLKNSDGTNNSRNISFTYKEAEEIMSSKTFTKARDHLVEKGFIDIVREGWVKSECNIYAFSERWKLYGTKDFQKETRPRRISGERTQKIRESLKGNTYWKLRKDINKNRKKDT